MNAKFFAVSCGILLCLSLTPLATAYDDNGKDNGKANGKSNGKGNGHANGHLRTNLTGFEEVAQAISTTGNGSFRMKLASDELSFEYTLTFAELEGTVTQAHIHFGQPAIAGGIMIWLCQTTTNPAPANAGVVPTCPAPGGTVTGTIDKTNVIGPAAQGIDPGQFAEVIAAIKHGFAYANVHSSKYPSGEIRGQIGD